MFKVGQQVVCKNINSINNTVPRGIALGEIYTIEAISTCICGRELLHLKEPMKLEKWCGYKLIRIGYDASFYSYRFEPLIGSWVEELLERITKEAKEEAVKELEQIK